MLYAPYVRVSLNFMEYQNLGMKECYMDFLEIMAVSSRQCTKHKVLEVIKKSAFIS